MRTSLHTLRLEDVADLAQLHEQAFPAFFLSSLGQPFLRQFYRGFVGDETAVAVVAHDERGTAVGAVVGTTEPNGYFSRLLRKRLAGFILASVQAALHNPKAVPRLLKAVRYRGAADGQVSGALLSSICVSPEARNTGVGSELLRAWERRATDLGACSAYLTTDAADNQRVNAFYQRNGWALHSSYTTAESRPMNVYTKGLEHTTC